MRVSSAGNGIRTEAQLKRLANDLAVAGQEVSTGRRVDPGRDLGRGTLDIARVREELASLDNITTTNRIVQSRLETMQRALGDVGDIATRMFAETTVTAGSEQARRVAVTAGAALDDLGRRLNVAQDGIYLFSASQVGSPAFKGTGDTAAMPLRAAGDAFFAHFGFAPTDAAAAGVTAPQMRVFLDGPFQALFEAPAWSSAWSGAESPAMHVRVAPGETRDIDVDARGPGVRALTGGLASLATFLTKELSEEARSVVAADAGKRIGASSAGIASMRGDLSKIEADVAAAGERMASAGNALRRTESLLVDVDPAEAAQWLNDVVQRLEASYAITKRLSEISLLKVL